jgi:hypothetical protein
MAYYTPLGPRNGPLRYPDAPAAIGVLESRDNPKPVGLASAVGWDDDGVAVWRLTICGAELPGSWIVVDREFRPAR